MPPVPFRALSRRLAGLARLALPLILVGCGGGGGDDDAAPEPPAGGPTYTVSGTIDGLERPIELRLIAYPSRGPATTLNTTHETLVVRNGAYAFATPIAPDYTAVVELGDLWRSPAQSCREIRPDGTLWGSRAQVDIHDADANIAWRCGRGYVIGGEVTGELDPGPLTVSAMTLAESTPAQAGSISTPGPFSLRESAASNNFRHPLMEGTPYWVGIGGDVACRVANGSGVMPAHDVDDVRIDCVRGTEIRFKVSGLKGSGMRILLKTEPPGDAGGLPLPGERWLLMSTPTDGDYSFDLKAYPGDRFTVSVYDPPVAPSQECAVFNAAGTVADDEPITNVEVRCPQPEKVWRYDGEGTLFTETPLHGGEAGLETVDERYDPPLAPANVTAGAMVGKQNLPLFQNLFDQPGTNMAVYSSEDGTDYRIATEAASSADPRITSIRTRWWLRKISSATEVRFLLTHLYLDAGVDNAGSGQYTAGHLNARAWVELRGHSISGVDGGVNPVPFHAAFGHVDLTARRLDSRLTEWNVGFGSDAAATAAIFEPGDLEADLSHTSPTTGGFAMVRLREPVELVVNLDSVPVGQRVLVEMIAAVQAQNVYSRESHAVAYLRDPATFDTSTGPAALELVALEGVTITEPGDLPAGFAPQPDTAPAPACAAPGAPRATLQFASPTFNVAEGDPTNRSVTVTRSGSSAGALTARVSMQPGSATPGLDYREGDVVVRFVDGDTTPRTVNIPVLQDSLVEGPETLLLTLGEVSGCADPGTQVSATVMLTDDEDPPPSTPGGTLDAGFGAAGKVAAYGIGGAPAAMALQPDGRIVMAGGSTADFVLARFLANGQLDTSFGGGGVVTTDIAGGFQQEQAHAVLVQPDGRIVVAGTAQPAGGGQSMVVTLARYLANGALDPSFGTGGVVFDPAQPGTAYAIALQGDGKLVVAGSAPVSGRGDDFADLLLARYDGSGQLDPGFGVGGRVVTDVVGATERARNVLVLPDGRIVASGMETGLFNTEPTLVMQVLPDGQPDPAFGTQGKLRLTGPLVGWALARQADGKLLLGGSTEFGPAARTAVLRLNADGNTDTGFGSAGLAVQAFSGNTDIAKAIVVQADGGLLVAGRTGGTNRNMAVIRLRVDGTLDAAFGTNGLFVVDFDNFPDEAERALLQPDGKLLLGGWARDRSNVIGYALARVQP